MDKSLKNVLKVNPEERVSSPPRKKKALSDLKKCLDVDAEDDFSEPNFHSNTKGNSKTENSSLSSNQKKENLGAIKCLVYLPPQEKPDDSNSDEDDEHGEDEESVDEYPKDSVDATSEKSAEAPLSSYLPKMFKRDAKSGLFECLICFKLLKESSTRQHLRIHYGIKPFKCYLCPSRFTRKGDVDRHIRSIHKPEEELKCSVCKSSFDSIMELKTHLEKHTNNLFYSCAECGFKCGKEEYYNDHLRFIHPQSKLQSNQPDLSVGVKQTKQLKRILEKLNKKPEQADSCLPGENFDEYIDVDERSDDSSILDESIPAKKSNLSSNKKRRTSQESESFTQNILLKNNIPSKDDNDLVDKAIDAALCRAEDIIDSIQSTAGNNFTSNSDVDSDPQSKLSPKSSVIQIAAPIGGTLQKFHVRPPVGSNIDATTQEGMGTIISMINYLCAGKGELDGPVEIVMKHKI